MKFQLIIHCMFCVRFRPKAKKLPYCIKDSLALARKQLNRSKIKQIKFLFRHRTNCLLTRENLLKKYQSQPNINRNWCCQACGLVNSTITYYCINCNLVSELAPIYKEPLKALRHHEVCSSSGFLE